MMSKKIVKKESAGLQVYTTGGLMGVASSISSSSDVQIPSLMLMQNNSTFVEEDEDINSGDFLHSISKEVWGRKNKEPVELIFCDMFKTQIVSDISAGKKKWLETNQWTDSMELDPYESNVDGVMVRKEKCFNYAVFRALDVKEVQAPDGVRYMANPIIVKFKGGSLKHGKRLNQMFKDYAMFGSPSWATTFFLTATQEEKDGSKYWAYDFKKGAQTMKEQQLAAEALCTELQTLKSNNALNVVDADETESDIKPVRTVRNHATGEDIRV